jgi:hypothetical protein
MIGGGERSPARGHNKKQARKPEMDPVTMNVARAVERGAATIKAVIEVTGLSRLKVERAVLALEKQKLLVRDGQGLTIQGSKAAPNARQCGPCSLCCDALEVAAVGKPVNQLCRHWVVGSGCSIYKDRPQMCRSFSCAWLQGHFSDEWFPDTARLVVHFSQGALNVAVDPACPDRWREEPYFSKLCELSLNGIRVNGHGGYATLIVVGSNRFLLLGRTAVADPTPFGTAFVPITPDTFQVWKARSPEHLQRLQERVAEIQRIRQEFGSCAIPDDDDPWPPYRPALLLLSRHSHASPK